MEKKMEVPIYILSLISTLLFLILAILLLPARKNTKLPPGPKPFPIIGNLLDLGDKPQKSLTNLAKLYGPIMSLKLGQVITIVISSAAMAKEVLQTHDQILSSRAVPDAATPYDHEEYALIWIPVSDLWRNLRKLCTNRLFSPKILDSNENLRRKKVEELVADIQKSAGKGLAVDIGASIFFTTLNLLSTTIFSVDLADPNSEIATEFRESVGGISSEIGKPNIGDFFPVLKKMDLQGIRKRVAAHMRKLLDFMDNMINQRLQLQKLPDFTPKTDFLQHLLNVGEESKDIVLDSIEIRHLLLVLFIGGTHTTSAMAQWAMAHLLQNPKAISKAKAELRQVIGEGNPMEESHIEHLPYLQAIIKETLRLQSTFLLPRRVGEEIAIGGFTIPKGAQILVNNWALGRDPTVWENPEMFEPERFLNMEFDVRGRSYELVAFGGGRRVCPGIPLAWRMLHLVVGSLVHWFDWKLEDGITPQDLNMEDKFGISLDMAHPLRALPLLAAKLKD